MVIQCFELVSGFNWMKSSIRSIGLNHNLVFKPHMILDVKLVVDQCITWVFGYKVIRGPKFFGI